jgi:hypothetical protein
MPCWHLAYANRLISKLSVAKKQSRILLAVVPDMEILSRYTLTPESREVNPSMSYFGLYR